MEAQETSTVESTETPSHIVEGGEQVTPQISFVNGKYQNASELEKGYINLQTRFGSFTGAPEEYSLKEGIDISSDDPLLANIKEIAKNGNMSNDMFNELIGAYTQQQDVAEKAYQESQMKALGENANERLQNIKDYAKANLGENAEALLESITDARAVQAIETLIEKTKAPAPAQVQAAPSMSKDKIMEMQFAKDAHGGRKMDDPQYQKEFQETLRNYLELGCKM